MTTLTDRYVHAALRGIPDAKRADIDRELRASIADAVDARREQGLSVDAAEHAVLVELGDPMRLAASYLDRPQFLIGPALYTDWWRLLRVLLVIVAPIAVGGVALGQLLAGDPFGQIIGETVVAALGIVVHLCFWTTLVFVIVDRSGAGSSLTRAWTPADLPPVPPRGGITPVEVVGAIIGLGFAVAALIWQQSASPFTDAQGDPIPFLLAENWSFWWPYLIVLLVVEVAYTIWVWRRGRWDAAVAVVNAVLALAFAGPALVLLLTDRVFEPAFLARLEWGDAQQVLTTVTAFAVVVLTVWDIVDVALKARRFSPSVEPAASTPAGVSR